MSRIMLLFLVLILAAPVAFGQTITRDDLTFYTAEWTGERFPDGRPKVPDDIIRRIVNVSLEEAWGVLRKHGYHNQFEGDWKMIREDAPFAGRVLTAQYMPNRPEFNRRLLARGHGEGRVGPSNSWPIDMLQEGDVYVADAYGKIIDGTLIGDNLGNSIFAKSKRGVVFNSSVRDLEGLSKIEGFNAFVRGFDPSYLQEAMLTGINVPIRIGRATVFPGDVVLAKRGGVIFVPAHLAEEVVVEAEIIALRDVFGHQRLREGRYTPGQIDTAWSDDIKADFLRWIDENPERLPVPKEDFLRELHARDW